MPIIAWFGLEVVAVDFVICRTASQILLVLLTCVSIYYGVTVN